MILPLYQLKQSPQHSINLFLSILLHRHHTIAFMCQSHYCTYIYKTLPPDCLEIRVAI